MEMQYNITSLLRCYKEIVFFYREKIFLGFNFIHICTNEFLSPEVADTLKLEFFNFLLKREFSSVVTRFAAFAWPGCSLILDFGSDYLNI